MLSSARSAPGFQDLRYNLKGNPLWHQLIGARSAPVFSGFEVLLEGKPLGIRLSCGGTWWAHGLGPDARMHTGLRGQRQRQVVLTDYYLRGPPLNLTSGPRAWFLQTTTLGGPKTSLSLAPPPYLSNGALPRCLSCSIHTKGIDVQSAILGRGA